MQRSQQKFEVFFDGDCPLCRREIDMVRRLDKSDRLILTDIASPSFVATDVSLDTLMREIHGRFPDGDYVTGVEVFRQIYDRIGFSFLVVPTRWPVVRHALHPMYRFFAYFRFQLAKRRMSRANCHQNSCQRTTNATIDSPPVPLPLKEN